MFLSTLGSKICDNKTCACLKKILPVWVLFLGFLAFIASCQEGTLNINNACSSNPCQNSGICSVQDVENAAMGEPAYVYKCLCPLEYAGENCEIDLCASLGCIYGSCVLNFDQQQDALVATCKCSPGYMGVNCNLPCLRADCGMSGATCNNNVDCNMANGYSCLPESLSSTLSCALQSELGGLCNDDQDCLSGSCTVNNEGASKEQAGICDCDKNHYGEQCRYARSACEQYGGSVTLVNNTALAGYCYCAPDYVGPTCSLNIVDELANKVSVENVSSAQVTVYTYDGKLYTTGDYLLRFPESLSSLLSGYQVALFEGQEQSAASSLCTAAAGLTNIVWQDYPNSGIDYLITSNAADEALFYLRMRDPANRLTSCVSLSSPVWHVVKDCLAAVDTVVAKASFPLSSFNASLTLGGITGSCLPGYVRGNNYPKAFCTPVGNWLKLNDSGECSPEDCGSQPSLPLHASYTSANTHYTGQAISAVCISGYSSSAINPLIGNIKCELNQVAGVSWQGSITGECLANNGTSCSLNNQCQEVCINGVCASPSALNGSCDEDGDCSANLKCSQRVNGALGTCGGSGALCSDNTQCNLSANLYCIPDLPLGATKSCKARNGYCDGDQDCLNAKCILAVGSSVGSCQALGFSCATNTDCLNDTVCVPNGPNSHVCLSPRLGGTCDDDTDCPSSPLAIHCGNGYCGGSGAICTTNNACDLGGVNDQGISYTCAPTGALLSSLRVCRPLSLTTNAYCDQADGNSDCSLGRVCVPNDTPDKNHLCILPVVGGTCDDDSDCPVSPVAVKCTNGICGGSGAICTDNSQCASTKDFYCIPGTDTGQICGPKNVIGGRCNLDTDCFFNNCSVNNDRAVGSAAGICGGSGALCADNSYCDASQDLICKPDVNGLKCSGQSPLGGSCNDRGDCLALGGLYYEIDCSIHMPTVNSSGVCGGLNAVCGSSAGSTLSSIEANKQCVSPYTCIGSLCKDKASLTSGSCDDDGDCLSGLKCSTSGSLGSCGGSGAVCQANSACVSPYTCIGSLCKDKASLTSGSCDDDGDCLSGLKCSTSGSLGSCGGSGAVCQANSACVLPYTCIGSLCKNKASLTSGSCDDDADCLSGLKCSTSGSLGSCGGSGAVCQANLECATPYTCIGSLCKDKASLTSGSCDDDGDCLSGLKCSTSGSLGSCGGSGAVCQANPECATPYTCIGSLCKNKASLTSGSCDDDGDCLSGIRCSTSGSLGSCGGSGAVCQANPECATPYTCIGSLCKDKASLTSGSCDDDADCLSGLKCSTSGSLGTCGGSGAVCQDNAQCSLVYSCIGGHCADNASLTSGNCDDNGDCLNGLKCSTSGSLGTCGGSGAVCQANPECVTPYTCIGSLCKDKATLNSGSCDDDGDCLNNIKCSTSGSLGSCGGSGAVCQANPECATPYTCIGSLCKDKASLTSGSCDDDGDCLSGVKCSTSGSLGTCGGSGAVCQANSACVLPYTCIGSLCKNKASLTSGSCDDDGDCLSGIKCSTSGSLGTCGGSGAVCQANPECATPYTCIGSLCKNKASLTSGSCDDDGDCLSGIKCSTSGSLGSCGGSGAICQANPECATPYTCIGSVCKDKATLNSGSCDDNADCLSGVKCSTSGSLGTCGGSGAICQANPECATPYTCIGGVCKDKATLNSGSCDDNADCLSGVKCSTSGSLGSCGGSGAICQANPECATPYTCIGSVCKDKATLNSGSCDDNADCLSGVKCSTSGSLGVCGGSGAICQDNLECVPPYTCIGSVCKDKATLNSGSCDDNSDCLSGLKCSTSGSLGSCGGSGAVCQANPECATPYTCIGSVCQDKATLNSGSCDDNGDCLSGLKCSTSGSLGSCGGSGAVCTGNSQCNSASGLYCIPDAGSSQQCTNVSLSNGRCNFNDDCSNHNCTVQDDISVGTSAGICGGSGAICQANPECATPYTCINSVCKDKATLTSGFCDDDGDCVNNLRCSVAWSVFANDCVGDACVLGFCRQEITPGDACLKDSDCLDGINDFTCISGKCVVKANLGQTCDSDQDCVASTDPLYCDSQVVPASNVKICSKKCPFFTRPSLPSYAYYADNITGVWTPGTSLTAACIDEGATFGGYYNHLTGNILCLNDGSWTGAISGSCLGKIGAYCTNNAECEGGAGGRSSTNACVHNQCVLKELGSLCEINEVEDCSLEAKCIGTNTFATCLGKDAVASCTTNNQCISGQCLNGLCNITITPLDNAVLAMGVLHTCAILADNTIKCWGNNTYKQQNIVLNAGEQPLSIAAMTSHTCLVLSNGNVRCFGCGSPQNYGQCNISLSQLIARKVVTGFAHTCVLLNNGQVECFGCGGSFNYGQCSLSLDGLTAIDIAAGYFYTCVVLVDGSVRCFGNNSSGQVQPSSVCTYDPNLSGSARTFCNSRTPTNTYSDPRGYKILKVAAGYGHTIVLLENGAVSTFGGEQSAGYNLHPILPYVPAKGIDLAASGFSACALLERGDPQGAISGNVSCFGDNRYQGNTTNLKDRYAVQVDAGFYGACALLTNGDVSCFGCQNLDAGNNYGQCNVPAEVPFNVKYPFSTAPSCTNNSECRGTCLGGICQNNKSDLLGACDLGDDADCALPYICSDTGQCILRTCSLAEQPALPPYSYYVNSGLTYYTRTHEHLAVACSSGYTVKEPLTSTVTCARLGVWEGSVSGSCMANIETNCDCQQSSCGYPLVCAPSLIDNTNFACALPRGLGEICRLDNQCAYPLKCSVNNCLAASPGVCVK